MKLLALAVVLLAFLPACAAGLPIQGQVVASSVAGNMPSEWESGARFLGLFEQQNQKAPIWHVQAEKADVSITSIRFTSYGGLYGSQQSTDSASTAFLGANLASAPSTLPPENGHLLWLTVVPTADPAALRGTIPVDQIPIVTNIQYSSYQNPSVPLMDQAPQSSSSDRMIGIQYFEQGAAFEWKPAAAAGEFTLHGDFVLSVFQTDFDAQDASGYSKHYSTGEDEPNQTVPSIHDHTQSRADITVHNGTLVLSPNDRAMQVDLANAAATLHGNLDLSDAHGSLSQQGSLQALDGHVHMVADDLKLTLQPRSGQIGADFTGTLSTLSVDGKGIALAPDSAIPRPVQPSWAAPATLLLAAATILGAGLAVAWRRSRDDVLNLSRAQALFELQRHRHALRLARRILRHKPGDLDATTLAAMSLIHLGRPQHATPLLAAAHQAGQDDGLLGVMGALVHFHSGRPMEAQMVLQEAFRAHPALEHETAARDLLDQLDLLNLAPAPQASRPRTEAAA